MCLPLFVLFVCVCACGVCLCTVCVCVRLCLYLCLCVCVCMCFFAVCLCRSLKICVYLCLLLLKIWHSISISFLLIICIIFNEAFTYNVFDTTYKRVTCSSTLSGHPSLISSVSTLPYVWFREHRSNRPAVEAVEVLVVEKRKNVENWLVVDDGYLTNTPKRV